MEANDTSNVPGHGGVIDRATLYLCRQGEKWVVVIESARISGALRFRDAGEDAYDARFELLSRAAPGLPRCGDLQHRRSARERRLRVAGGGAKSRGQGRRHRDRAAP